MAGGWLLPCVGFGLAYVWSGRACRVDVAGWFRREWIGYVLGRAASGALGSCWLGLAWEKLTLCWGSLGCAIRALPIVIVHWYNLWLLSIVIVDCYCLLRLPVASDYWYRLLQLRVVIACCSCLLILPVATCLLQLPAAITYCYCPCAMCNGGDVRCDPM